MNNTNSTTRTGTVRAKKGYLGLAPGGQKLFAVMSAIGWLTFLIKFAVV